MLPKLLMSRNILRVILLTPLWLGACSIPQEKLPVDYIDPIIGAVTYGKKTKDAHGFGKTFPGAATPFGLVQLSPDTYTGGDNG
jgi:putative alpha-1,2-mannosidase